MTFPGERASTVSIAPATAGVAELAVEQGLTRRDARSDGLSATLEAVPSAQAELDVRASSAILDRLLERDAERGLIEQTIAAATTGDGRLLVIEGAAGLGKTSLLRAAAEVARESGARVLWARGSELETSFPFGLVRQLLEPPLRLAEGGERERLLSGAAHTVGELLDASAGQATGPDVRFSLLNAMYWLCANMAVDGPLMLAVDDAHWGDEPSLDFLGFAARRLEGLPLLLAVASRPSPEARAAAAQRLLAEPSAVAVRPAPLSRAAVEEWIIGAAGGDETLAGWCHEATRGNPLLVTELLRDGPLMQGRPYDGPFGLAAGGASRLVLSRLGRLGTVAHELARAVAVLGEGSRLSDAAALAGLDGGDVAEAADALIRSEVLDYGENLTFVHPIVREAVYREMSAPERATRHLAAAEYLRARGAPVERVAAQLLVSEPAGHGWVVETLREAAHRALAAGDPLSAARALDRALAESPDETIRPELLVELGSAELRVGDPMAEEHLRQGRELAGDPRCRIAAAVELARYLTLSARHREALGTFEAAHGEAQSIDRTLAEIIEMEMLTAAALTVSGRRTLRRRLRRWEDPGGVPSTLPGRFALAMRGSELAVAGESATGTAEAVLRAIEGLGLPQGVMTVDALRPFEWAPVLLMFADRFEEAERLFTGMLEEANRHGAALAAARIATNRAELYWRMGKLADAQADANAALELEAELVGVAVPREHAAAVLVHAGLDRGESYDELAASLQNALGRADEEDTTHGEALVANARLLLERGQPDRARDAVLAAGGWEQRWTRSPCFGGWRTLAALVHARLGEQDEARRLAGEALDLARAFGAPRPLGMALRTAGLVHGSIERLREAVAVLAPSGARLEHARALVDLGAAIRRSGHSVEARKPLREGLDLAARCDAIRLTDRAREELRAAGAKPRRAILWGSEALTPAERRVAEHAARGLTNREIAQTLFVTEKTVETHLGSIYRKLDIGSRHRLPAALAA